MRPAYIPQDIVGKQLYDFVVKNEQVILHAKKSETKTADTIAYSPVFIDSKGQIVSKADEIILPDAPGVLKAELVINTTNWFDSHYDVHIPGLWKKSLGDNKKSGFYLLNQHKCTFESVIADGMKGETRVMSWKDVGLAMPGNTEALVFSGMIDKKRNEYMFGQYAAGYVKQHSVGMRYVKILTCINDDDYPVQKENWDKYFPMVANKSDCEEEGLFWAVLEAKVQEGSAVLFASNTVTPTLTIEADDSTKNEPPAGTHGQPQSINIAEAIKNVKFFQTN